MSLKMSGYKELGLELVYIEDMSSHTPKRPSTTGENKDAQETFYEEALAQ
jgi:hypothetical protein